MNKTDKKEEVNIAGSLSPFFFYLESERSRAVSPSLPFFPSSFPGTKWKEKN